MSSATDFMKPLSWDNKQLGLASPLQSAASQSGQPITLARMRGLDVSHHTRISQRDGEKSFFLTSSLQKLNRPQISGSSSLGFGLL